MFAAELSKGLPYDAQRQLSSGRGLREGLKLHLQAFFERARPYANRI